MEWPDSTGTNSPLHSYPAEFIVRVDSFECECLVISPVVARGWYVVCHIHIHASENMD